MLIATLKPDDRDHYRMPKAVGDGWVMLTPECVAVDCTNGRARFSSIGVCELCQCKSSVEIKPRWLQAHPERYMAFLIGG